MENYNRNERYRDDNRPSYKERNYDMNWDRNYNTEDDYRGYNNGNRNVYSSDRERDYWNSRYDRNYNNYNNINRDSYADRYDRNYNTGGFPDYRNGRYSDYDRNYTNDYNSRNDFYRNDRYHRYNDYNVRYMDNRYDRHYNNNDRYNNEGWRNNNRDNNFRNNDRGWWDKTKDEVASWFGDDDAERRRRRDELRSGQHRGKGPKNYTRSEERIREDVSDKLTDDSFLDASGIEVNVKDGDVTLNGSVDSRYSKHRAEDLAEDVTGVQHVQNNLRVFENTENTIDKSSVNNGNKNITPNTSYNTTKNKKEISNA